MKAKLKPIYDQVVVLLGATSGIGLETAKLMAEKGATVVVVGRSQEGLNEAIDQVRSHAEASRMAYQRGRNGHTQMGVISDATGQFASEITNASVSEMTDQVIGLEADVTNFEQVRSVAEQVVQRFGHLDTWVNLAAVSEYALFEDTTPEEFQRIIQVNLLGQAYGAMAALPYLKQQGGGALIFVSSIEGRIPMPYHSAYNASKHGVLGLAETLRQEIRHTGVPVSVTTILPASINTPLFEKSRTKLGVEPEPLPPVYDARMAAKAIVHAAHRPVRELIVGDMGYMMNFMRRLAPTLTSNMVGASGFRMQRSNEPKSAQAPDNLYQHISGYEQVEGGYMAKPFSVLTWFSTHPKARNALYGGLLAAAGALVGYRIYSERNRRRGWRYQLPRQARRFYQDASKATSRAFHNAEKAFVAMPVVSNLPGIRRRSFSEKVGDSLIGWWAAITSLSLPFIGRRKSFKERVTDRIPEVHISAPWDGSKRFAKQTAKQATRQSNKAMEIVDKRVKRAQQRAEKAMDRIDDRRKETMKAVSHAMPSRSDIKDMMRRGEVVERRRSFVERVPFGERCETIVEKVPYKK